MAKYDPNKERKIAKKKRDRRKQILFGVLAVIVVAATTLSVLPNYIWNTSYDESVQKVNKSYSYKELKLIESSSFKKISESSITVGDKQDDTISSSYKSDVIDFAYSVFSKTENKDKNFSYSPLSLYYNLEIVALAGENNSETQDELDDLLGQSLSSRKQYYLTSLQNNNYKNETGTVQVHNGAFLSNKYDFNSVFTTKLTRYNVEGYSLDFSKTSDVNKMLSWIDQRVYETGFMSAKDLEVSDDSMAYFISTLYFDNIWQNTFATSSSYKANFYNVDGEKEKAKFMSHTYTGDYYEYDDYISVFDYYENGYKVQYVMSLDDNKTIHEIVNGLNFLNDTGTYNSNKLIELSVPKFEIESMNDFTDVLQSNWLKYTMSSENNSLSDIYSSTDASVYLGKVKQKTKINFSEDGTTIKTVTSSAIETTSLEEEEEELETKVIRLNKPFYYVIYDKSGLPIYMGEVDTVK